MEWISVKEGLPKEEWEKYRELYNDDGLEIICMVQEQKLQQAYITTAQGLGIVFLIIYPSPTGRLYPNRPKKAPSTFSRWGGRMKIL